MTFQGKTNSVKQIPKFDGSKIQYLMFNYSQINVGFLFDFWVPSNFVPDNQICQILYITSFLITLLNTNNDFEHKVHRSFLCISLPQSIQYSLAIITLKTWLTWASCFSRYVPSSINKFIASSLRLEIPMDSEIDLILSAISCPSTSTLSSSSSILNRDVFGFEMKGQSATFSAILQFSKSVELVSGQSNEYQFLAATSALPRSPSGCTQPNTQPYLTPTHQH